MIARLLAMGAGVLFMLALAFNITRKEHGYREYFQSEAVASAKPAQQPIPKELLDAINDPSDWFYLEKFDRISDKGTIIAGAISENKINFSPPYDGGSDMTIQLRKHPRMETDVLLEISNGQMLCSSYNGCTVTVRFDDKKARRYSASGPSDNGSQIIFINDASGFIANLKKSKKLVVEQEFYQDGYAQFQFKTKYLHWPPTRKDLDS